jgi:hypothetical protein
MSLPKKYDERIRKALGVRSVWQPGDSMNLGDVLVRKDDRFFAHDELASFGATFKVADHKDKSLDLASSGTKQRIFQANAELPSAAKLDLTAEASVKLEFASKYEFILKTPTLSGHHIANVNQVAMAVYKNANWRHDDYYIVHELYEAAEFTFLGTEQSSSNIEVSGKGAGILSFLTAGASAGISVTGSIDLKIVGTGGPVAMGLVRIKKDGSTKHD